MKPSVELLEARDCPSTTTPTTTFGQLAAPPTNPATSDPALQAMLNFGLGNLKSSVGFGTVPTAQANAFYAGRYANWYNTVEPDGHLQGDDWNASIAAQHDPWMSANWTQTPPPGQQAGPGMAYAMQPQYGYTPPVSTQQPTNQIPDGTVFHGGPTLPAGMIQPVQPAIQAAPVDSGMTDAQMQAAAFFVHQSQQSN